jgi:hypothetical protein
MYEMKSDLWKKIKLAGKAYILPVTTLASSGQTALVEGSLAESRREKA